MSNTEAADLVTVGEIADALGLKVHQIRYYLESREIPHVAKVGGYRVWNRSIIEDVRKGLKAEE